jgi:hypothetical protein
VAPFCIIFVIGTWLGDHAVVVGIHLRRAMKPSVLSDVNPGMRESLIAQAEKAIVFGENESNQQSAE